MAIDRENMFMDLTGSYLHRKVAEQSWYQENSNTVTTVVGLVLTAIAYLGTTPFSDSVLLQACIFFAGFVGTVFGVKFTPNGFSKSQVAKIQAARASMIGETPLVETSPEDLDARVAEYNNGRE